MVAGSVPLLKHLEVKLRNITLSLALLMMTGCSMLCHNEQLPIETGTVPARKLSGECFLMSRDWGKPSELLIYASGWNIRIFSSQGEISLTSEGLSSSLTIEKFSSSPAYDYARLSGWANGFKIKRHILLDKLTGLIVLADEIPIEQAPALRMLLNGQQVKRLVLEQPQNRTIIVDPMMRTANSSISSWDVLVTPLGNKQEEPTGAAIRFTTDGRTSYYWLSRSPALVADNAEDNMIEGRVGVIHKSPDKTTLELVSGNWMQCGNLILRVTTGAGTVQFHQDGSITGWTDGGRRDVAVDTAKPLLNPKLIVDGKPSKLTQKDARLIFHQSSGVHVFTIQ